MAAGRDPCRVQTSDDYLQRAGVAGCDGDLGVQVLVLLGCVPTARFGAEEGGGDGISAVSRFFYS